MARRTPPKRNAHPWPGRRKIKASTAKSASRRNATFTRETDAPGRAVPCHNRDGSIKRVYYTRQEAKRAARETGGGVGPYLCPGCGAFHVGH